MVRPIQPRHRDAGRQPRIVEHQGLVQGHRAAGAAAGGLIRWVGGIFAAAGAFGAFGAAGVFGAAGTAAAGGGGG